MFLYPALTVGFLFVGVPLLVHLINMLRHRRQPWAAMDFLLASYRKQKKWIVLRQFLLWLARTAVAAALIAMLCGWISGGKLLNALGGRTTHHVIVLDDSYSMAETSSGAPAYRQALAMVRSLTERLARADGQHQLTVLRSSRADLVARGGRAAGDAAADVAVQTVTGDDSLIERLMATAASSMQVDVVPPLQLAAEMIGNTPADETVLYLISDFRARDWRSPERVKETLESLSDDGIDVRFLDAAGNAAGNVAVTELRPLPDVWVAGVPVVMQVKVKNYSDRPVSNVNLAARVVRYGSSATAPDPTRLYSGDVESQPGLVIDRIDAGQETVRQFQVYLTEPGQHAVEVTLPDDALTTDNRRTCVLPLSDVQRVLIVDGEPDGTNAYHVASVLDPSSQVRTGAVPDVRSTTFLRSATLEELLEFKVIYVIDPEQVTDGSAAALSEYVRAGGGVVWMFGGRAQAESLNQTLLAEERLLLPATLKQFQPLERARQAGSDIVMPGEHPITDPLRPLGDAVFGRVAVARSWQVDANDPRVEQAVEPEEVLTRRDGEPLVVSHRLGKGRVVTVLTGLQPAETNWRGDPTFVVFLLRTNAFLWSAATPVTSRLVDEPIVIAEPSDRFARTAQVLTAVGEPPRVAYELPAESTEGRLSWGLDPREAAVSGGSDVDLLLQPGVTEVWLTQLTGEVEVRTFASTVAAGEGDLTRIEQAALQRELEPVAVRFFEAAEVLQESEGRGRGTTTLVLLALLGVLLACEQALAYWASYHPPRMGGAA